MSFCVFYVAAIFYVSRVYTQLMRIWVCVCEWVYEEFLLFVYMWVCVFFYNRKYLTVLCWSIHTVCKRKKVCFRVCNSFNKSLKEIFHKQLKETKGWFTYLGSLIWAKGMSNVWNIELFEPNRSQQKRFNLQIRSLIWITKVSYKGLSYGKNCYKNSLNHIF